MFWSILALPLPLLAGVADHLVPSRAGQMARGAVRAACMVIAAALIALPRSTGWAVQARYHLFADQPTFLILSVDGLSIVVAVALLLSAAWAEMGRDNESARASHGRYWLISAMVGVLLAANALTLFLAWSVLGLVRAVASRRQSGRRYPFVIAAELLSLTALLAASQTLGRAGISRPFYPAGDVGLTGWLVALAGIARMGVYPLQMADGLDDAHALTPSLSGLYLLLRAAPELPALAAVAAGLALLAAWRAARSTRLDESWDWLIQHALILGVLGAIVGPGGKLAGLVALVCVSLCHPVRQRLGDERLFVWELVPVGALGGLAPTLGWVCWAALLGVTSNEMPTLALLAVGTSYGVCAWAAGRVLRLVQLRSFLWPSALFDRREAWRAFPGLALLILGLWPSLLTYHGAASPWAGATGTTGFLQESVSWLVALVLAVLTGAVAALAWSRGAFKPAQTDAPTSNHLVGFMEKVQGGAERARDLVTRIDLALREYATLIWTTLAVATLILWLRGR